ncbi:MAG: hypothetical protein NVS1B4_13640 [Gemmatimonadaceae bacterium]
MVGAAQRADQPDSLRSARCAVNAAKIALGERGPVWWHDGAPDYNRRLVTDTPYKAWYAGLPGIKAPATDDGDLGARATVSVLPADPGMV